MVESGGGRSGFLRYLLEFLRSRFGILFVLLWTFEVFFGSSGPFRNLSRTLGILPFLTRGGNWLPREHTALPFSHTVVRDAPMGVKGTSFWPREGVPCSFRMGTDAYGGPSAECVGHPFDRDFIAHVEVDFHLLFLGLVSFLFCVCQAHRVRRCGDN